MKKKRFQKIYIEIINRCNLCCSFCPTSDRPSRMMSVDEFEKVAAQAAPFTDYICLHVKGEPLMHPWLGDILSIAHQNGLKVNLTTNAVLLPEKQQLLLGETAPRQISLSLHFYIDITGIYQFPALESGRHCECRPAHAQSFYS